MTETPWKETSMDRELLQQEHETRDRAPIPRRNMGPGIQTGSDIIQRPPPVDRMTDTCKNIPLPQTLHAFVHDLPTPFSVLPVKLIHVHCAHSSDIGTNRPTCIAKYFYFWEFTMLWVSEY